MKRLKVILFVLLILCPIPVFASTRTYTRTRENPLVPDGIELTEEVYQEIMSTPAVDATEKIYDYADLLDDREENLVYKDITNYIRTTKIDAIIVTIKNINGVSLDRFASNFYQYNMFSKDGIIFIIHMGGEKPELYIKSFGEGDSKAFSQYDDNRKTKILYMANKYILKGKYYDGMECYIRSLLGFYDAKASANYHIEEDGTVIKDIPWIEIIIIVVSFTFIGTLIFLFKIHNNNVLKSKDDLKEKIDDSTFLLQLEVENFIGDSVPIVF